MLIKNSIGLTFDFMDNGSIKNIESEGIRINLKPGTHFSKDITNIYLRKRSPEIEFHPLFGQNSNAHFTFINEKMLVKGVWNQLQYTCILELAEKSHAWKWKIEITNNSDQSVELDLVYFHEVGLKTINNGLVNEYYVSQYLERVVLQDVEHGAYIACRQNNKEISGHPWLLLFSKQTALSGLTDGMQFYGNSHRVTGVPEGLLQRVFSGNMAAESPVVALQEKPFILKPKQRKNLEYLGIFIPNHAKATSDKDFEIIKKIQSDFTDENILLVENLSEKSVKNLFNVPYFLPVSDLNQGDIEQLYGTELQHFEKQDDKWLSFFTQNNHHVISKQKESLVHRPHAHILQANIGMVPNENQMSTTCFATGVFNSHISQGNTNFNVLLSVNTSQFNTNLESGQRIFVKYDNQHFLLGIPSAFEMGLDFCRWIYKYEKGIFEITTKTLIDQPIVETTFNVVEGNPVELVITHDFDKTNKWNINFGTNENEFVAVATDNSMIKKHFHNAQFRIQTSSQFFKSSLRYGLSAAAYSVANDIFVLETAPTNYFSIKFIGELQHQWNGENQTQSGVDFWKQLGNQLQLKSENQHIQAINSMLPWYGMNAITHYLTPYGLEQFSGAAWGTRDVSQGPIELLLSLEKYEAAKTVLLTIFANQNSFGDWSQWWMFDSYRDIRAGDCHGDIYYWVMISVANYIKTTGDIHILQEKIPYFDDANLFTIQEHLDRLTQMIVNSYIDGTALVPFGGGDWNDSLQPVNEELAKRLISSWTVEMNFQAFTEIYEVYQKLGDLKRAEDLKKHLQKIHSDFNKYLIKDNVVAGYGYLEDDKSISVLFHPTDTKTGIKYSLLPMNRGIICGIFTKEQALSHQKIINQFLKGPDGARLMDKPLKYKGGIQEIFQRAESSTFFGREIGLMYIHEHIRYAESQAILGNADEFIKALRQAIPIEYQNVVPQGSMRQANCYYSSSDVTFTSRYAADYKYQDVLDGKMTLDGGWRVYSSGPGIYISLIIKKLLGFRVDSENIVLDPVLTKEMDGLEAQFKYKNNLILFKFKVLTENYHPKKLLINNKNITFECENNRYRKGGAKIGTKDFNDLLTEKVNHILVEL